MGTKGATRRNSRNLGSNPALTKPSAAYGFEWDLHDDEAGVVADLTETLTALQKAGFTFVVIDTKGEDGHATRAAMRVADLCLIPVRPAGPDLHATRTTTEALRTMGRDFALVVNQTTANKAAKLTSAVMAGLAQSGPVVPIPLASRMDFQYSYALGLGVAEHAPASKAAEEITEFWAWCRKRIKKEKTGEQQDRRRA